MTARTNPFAQPRPGPPPATESRNIVRLDCTAIRTDGGTQARVQMDEPTVTEYADAMRRGATFPPVVVYYDGDAYWLGDGFHRLKAHKQAHGSAQPIAAEVRQGTRRDAILCAVGANATHGLRRTSQDKRNAIATLLRDEEWSQWSDREIARITHTTHPTVAKIRAEIAAQDGHEVSSRRRTADGRTIDTANIGANQPNRDQSNEQPTKSRHAHPAPGNPGHAQATQGSPGPAAGPGVDTRHPTPDTESDTAEWQRLQRLHTALSDARIRLDSLAEDFDAYGLGKEAERITVAIHELREKIAHLTPEDRQP